MRTIQATAASGVPKASKRMTHGDENGFGEELRRYSPTLYKMALRKLGNVEDAEDALQDALLSAFKNMHKFRGEARFSTWLGTIVLNSARMQIRRRPNYNLVSLDENEEGQPLWAEKLEDSGPDAEETLHRKQTSDTLQRIVEDLSAPLRVTFRLRVFDGLSTSEAATALGVPEGTVKARFFHARTQVAARMREAINSTREAKAQDRLPCTDQKVKLGADYENVVLYDLNPANSQP